MKGQNVCKNHGGAAPQARRKAAERILLAQDLAAAKLVELMNNPDVPYSVQRMAAADLLDRGGNVAAHVLAIPGLGDASKQFEQILTKIVGGSRDESRSRRGESSEQSPEEAAGWTDEDTDVIDVEIVGDDEDDARPVPVPSRPEPLPDPEPANGTGMLTMQEALEQLRSVQPPPAAPANRRAMRQPRR